MAAANIKTTLSEVSKLDKESYDEYVRKSIQQGIDDIESGNYISLEEWKKEFSL